MRSLKQLLVVAACLAVLPRARGQDDDARAGLSRSMRTAVHFYEQGDDMQAMDRFMEILTKGNPSERSMANEYINLITHRMNGASGAGGGPAPAPAPPVGEAQPAPVKTSSERAPRGGEMSPPNKALMRKEIKARLRAAQERGLSDLKAVEGVRVAMRENGDPEALGIPSPLLFQEGISFRRDAGRLLEPLTKLVFALGSTQVLILPEGTSRGEAKVLDMRRTMGISSALYQAGVAPPRVRVNLLNTQVDIPKSLTDFKGVVVVFQYAQPMALSAESAVGDELGPPISLGVFPSQIRPSRNQGAIIEFSVSDPPAGLVSWKFSLLQPSKEGAELAPMQQVVGGGPVFHQIFWNGRKNYFGSPLPAGRYECVLTALDAKNRQRTLHKWIQVLPDENDGEKLLAAPPQKAPSAAPPADAAKAPPAAAPSAELGVSRTPLVNGVKPAAAKPQPRRKVVRRGVRAKPSAKAATGAAAKTARAEAAPAHPGHYELAFGKNTHQMTSAAEKALAQAASDFASYPLETLRVTGHAAGDETDGAALAERRAKMVAGLLINRYQVDPKKIEISSSAGEGATVELVFARGN